MGQKHSLEYNLTELPVLPVTTITLYVDCRKFQTSIQSVTLKMLSYVGWRGLGWTGHPFAVESASDIQTHSRHVDL
jgi:hypothetical protein